MKGVLAIVFIFGRGACTSSATGNGLDQDNGR